MNKILIYPHPYLRQKAKKIDLIKNEEIKIARSMMNIISEYPGVGLAANQMGILKQIVVVCFNEEKTKQEKKYILFNPTILSYSKKKIIMEEGCLSFPDQYSEIERPEEIKLEYININNQKVKKKVNGLESRILQHEIDHLKGKLFIDYLSSLKRNIIIKKLKKFLKKKEKNER